MLPAEPSKKLEDHKTSADKIQSPAMPAVMATNGTGHPAGSASSSGGALTNGTSDKAEEQQMLVPDSTTSQLEGKQSFTSGDDVFVKQRDGRYYLGEFNSMVYIFLVVESSRLGDETVVLVVWKV